MQMGMEVWNEFEIKYFFIPTALKIVIIYDS